MDTVLIFLFVITFIIHLVRTLLAQLILVPAAMLIVFIAEKI